MQQHNYGTTTESTAINSGKKILFLCTGLGKVNRGFEQYVAGLAAQLQKEVIPGLQLEVWTGGVWQQRGIKSRRIPHIHRRHWLVAKTAQPFLWEQRSFFAGMIPALLQHRPSLIYLGEYQLYCYLYKLRAALGLHYSLVLYTGGQAIPGHGVFDAAKDRIHHITPRYLPECSHWPANVQVLAPHFVNNDFQYEVAAKEQIREMAKGKKIVLSVGLLDKEVKRMDLLVAALAPLKEEVFPVLLGADSAFTEEIRNQLELNFGRSGFLMQEVLHSQLGDYYAIADLFVSCSPKESFGLALVEALWHGLPVICADFAEARWVLGEHATFVREKEPKHWTMAIQQAIHTTSSTTQQQQRQSWAKERYSWPAVKEHYSTLFCAPQE